LERALEILEPNESRVLLLRHGMEDDIPRTLEEIGREFGVSRERIRQIESKAVKKLKRSSVSKALEEYLAVIPSAALKPTPPRALRKAADLEKRRNATRSALSSLHLTSALAKALTALTDSTDPIRFSSSLSDSQYRLWIAATLGAMGEVLPGTFGAGLPRRDRDLLAVSAALLDESSRSRSVSRAMADQEVLHEDHDCAVPSLIRELRSARGSREIIDVWPTGIFRFAESMAQYMRLRS
jgi:hypothetical protein